MFGEYMYQLALGAFRFSGAAAMRPDGSTRISAVVALLPIRVHRNCVEAGRRMFTLTNGFARDLSENEKQQIHWETAQYVGQVEPVTRAVVVDNPFAQRPLGSNIYKGPVCHPSRYQREFEDAMEEAGFEVRCQIIWAKNTFAWGFRRYKFQHEPIFYAHRKGESDPWYGDKSQSTLWEEKKPSARTIVHDAHRSVWVLALRHSATARL